MRHTVAAVVVLLLSFTLSPIATASGPSLLEATFTPGGTPFEPVARAVDKNSFPDFALVLPYFVVDTTNGSGVTTLFAMRNRQNIDRTVRIAIFDRNGDAITDTTGVMTPNETVTVNLRDILTPNSGFQEGSVIAAVVDPNTGRFLNQPALTGDYFIVDPGSNFADGDTLAQANGALCKSWDVRFLNGGPFNGGTLLRVNVLLAPPVGGNLLQGNVYDEDGDFMGGLTITGNGSSVGILDTGSIKDLPAFGSIELSFSGGEDGYISVLHSAENRYSIGMRGFCTD